MEFEISENERIKMIKKYKIETKKRIAEIEEELKKLRESLQLIDDLLIDN